MPLLLATIRLLAQDVPQRRLLGFDDIFWMTILVILIVGVIGALLRLRQRDKCLKLLHDYHVTYVGPAAGAAPPAPAIGSWPLIWGDARIVNRGLEIVFDKPYQDRRGLIKRSRLIYEDEYRGCLGLFRTPYGLTEEESIQRRRQIERSYQPGIFRRLWRWLRNIVNTIRDALTRTFTIFTGALTRGRPVGGAIAAQQGQVDQLGQTIFGIAGNAYEALLERHVGRPVILEIVNRAAPNAPTIALPGYLVDYSEEFVAVFSASQETLEQFDIEVSESITRDGVSVEVADGNNIIVRCESDDPIIVHRLTCGEEVTDLSVVLIRGVSVRLRCERLPVTLNLERTRTIDVVCPRSIARVRFGGGGEPVERPRAGWRGAAPDAETE